MISKNSEIKFFIFDFIHAVIHLVIMYVSWLFLFKIFLNSRNDKVEMLQIRFELQGKITFTFSTWICNFLVWKYTRMSLKTFLATVILLLYFFFFIIFVNVYFILMLYLLTIKKKIIIITEKLLKSQTSCYNFFLFHFFIYLKSKLII